MKSPPKAVHYSGGNGYELYCVSRLQIHITESSSSAVIEGVVSSTGFRLRNFDAVIGIVGVDRSAV